MKKIGLLGSRGMPNFYGGFEEFAEEVSIRLVKKGYKVFVYCEKEHPNKSNEIHGVHRILIPSGAKLGSLNQFVYDRNCLIDSKNRNFDVLINLGYTTSSIWKRQFPKCKIITNMDGLEWKREKYKGAASLFLKNAERLAISISDKIVADNPAVKRYLDDKFSIDSNYIAYGANIPPISIDKFLSEYELSTNNYDLIIARFQPDNNLEMVLKGYSNSKKLRQLVVVGNNNNSFGKKLIANFPEIKFLGGIYEKEKIESIRQHCFIYFHGHSAGGTNPSLLQAMASRCCIAAHSNNFNKAVLNENSFYFSNEKEVQSLIDTAIKNKNWTESNFLKVKSEYDWDKITHQYIQLF